MAIETIIPPSQKDGTAQGGALRYGSFTPRLLAFCVDTLGIFVVTGAIFLPLFFITVFASVILMPFLALFGLTLIPSFFMMFGMAHWIYFATMESSARGATFGKRLFGLRVVDEKGGKLCFARASVRFFAKILSALPMFLGFMMAIVTQRKQALHDLIAETLVIKA